MEKRLLNLPLLLMAVAGVGSVVQAEELPGSLQFHGFLSQAYIWTSDNSFFGDSSNGGTFDYRELGINTSWHPAARVQMAAQALSRRAGVGDGGDLRLDYGLIDYRLISNENQDWGLRAGRVKNPFGLYNETRDVALTRPSILLPESIYFDRARDLALSSDGAQLYGAYRTWAHDLRWEFGVGRPQVDSPEIERGFLGNDWPGLLRDDTSYVGRLMYEYDGGRLVLALTHAEVNFHYEPGAVDFIPAGSVRFTPTITSVQYNAGEWSITGEYIYDRYHNDDTFVGVLLPPSLQDVSGDGYYLQGIYRLAPRWKTLLRYDVIHADSKDRDGRQYEALTTLMGNPQPAHGQFAKDWTLGISWAANHNWMVSAELHKVDGTLWLPLSDNPLSSATVQQWRMFLLQVAYGF